jgi:hypothetical protein
VRESTRLPHFLERFLEDLEEWKSVDVLHGTKLAASS